MRLGFDFRRHVRFYTALACGLAAFGAARMAGQAAAALLGGDVFYLVFLALCAIMVARQTPADLKRRAREEDEGIGVVILVILVTVLFFVVAAFDALNKKHNVGILPLLLAGIGAPLGWFVLHTAMAFHYADIHYLADPECDDDYRDLDFPGRSAPGAWDFLYFSFVIGMTCQVSDVQVKTTTMRRTVLWHGVVSFFFNTVFIAMAVNAAVAMAAT
jgi:uncharacterized membrane protein